MEEDFPWIKKIRRLTQFLLLSGALNVAFLGTLLYRLSPRPAVFRAPTGRAEPLPLATSHIKVLNQYFSYSFEKLVSELENRELIEDGYTYRDLALATLASFHDFNLERALPGVVLQMRWLALVHENGGEEIEFKIYPGLKDNHFEMLRAYEAQEKWPLTAKGLFYELLRREKRPTSLKEAFFLTKEFHAIETLFHHLALALERDALLALLLEGGWERLSSFVERHPALDQLSLLDRRELLLDYAAAGVSSAIPLLVETDRDFVRYSLDDEHLTTLIAHTNLLTPEIESLLKDLLPSLRSDKVRTLAAVKLYAFNGESPPEPYDHLETLKRFLPEQYSNVMMIASPRPVQEKPTRLHRLKSGDTLWHISRQYSVSVDAIREANHLTSSYLLPVGKELKIPEN